MLRDSRTYEPFAASQVGRGESEFVIGQHSGTNVIQHELKKAGRIVSPELARQLLELARNEALRSKQPVRVETLLQMARRLEKGEVAEAMLRTDSPSRLMGLV